MSADPWFMPPMVQGAVAEAYRQRFLYAFDEELGRLLRENPDVAERIMANFRAIFEILAAGAKRREKELKATRERYARKRASSS
ncbi:hypothetical protein HY251_13315 [bacterium]|nr:hypothetical protein [bacterium]